MIDGIQYVLPRFGDHYHNRDFLIERELFEPKVSVVDIVETSYCFSTTKFERAI